MDRRHPLRLATVIVMFWQPVEATAQASTSAAATMAVGVKVTPSCTVAAEPLAFGTITAAQAPSRTATASIEVACGTGVAFMVQLDDGQYADNGTRRVLDPATGRTIDYEIFADAAHTRRWGSLDTQSVAGVTESSGAGRMTAYGLIGSDSQIAAGRYGDLVTVTTNF